MNTNFKQQTISKSKYIPDALDHLIQTPINTKNQNKQLNQSIQFIPQYQVHKPIDYQVTRAQKYWGEVSNYPRIESQKYLKKPMEYREEEAFFTMPQEQLMNLMNQYKNQITEDYQKQLIAQQYRKQQQQSKNDVLGILNDLSKQSQEIYHKDLPHDRRQNHKNIPLIYNQIPEQQINNHNRHHRNNHHQYLNLDQKNEGNYIEMTSDEFKRLLGQSSVQVEKEIHLNSEEEQELQNIQKQLRLSRSELEQMEIDDFKQLLKKMYKAKKQKPNLIPDDE